MSEININVQCSEVADSIDKVIEGLKKTISQQANRVPKVPWEPDPADIKGPEQEEHHFDHIVGTEENE